MLSSANKQAAPTLATAGTVRRVVALLRLLAEAQADVCIKEVSDITGLSPSTVHRLFDLLQQEGMVERDAVAHRYGGGKEFIRLGSLMVGKMPFRSVASPLLQDAALACEETCYFTRYLRSLDMQAITAKAESSQPLDYRLTMDRPFPLVWGASGLAILAQLPANRARAILKSCTQPDAAGASPPGWTAMSRELALVRRQGYAMSFGHRIPDAVGITAPVFNTDGAVFGALGFTVPRHRFTARRKARFIAVAISHADEMSKLLASASNAPRQPVRVTAGR